MDFLKRYSLLALLVVSMEILFLFLFRKPLEDRLRVPKTFEEMFFGGGVFSAGFLPDLFAEDKEENLEIAKGKKIISATERSFIQAGLIDVHEIDSTIQVELKYATEDNFLKQNLYGSLNICYLQKDIAVKLSKAQKLLQEDYPYYSLKIFDGARPVSIQQKMWDEVDVPEKLKDKYVSDPAIGSLHNYGCAVDVTIVNDEGWEMDMGTGYDHFGELAYPMAEKRLIKEGRLTWRQYENRKLLRHVMLDAGFTMITSEWWHFNGSSLKIASNKYEIVR